MTTCQFCSLRPATMNIPVAPADADSHLVAVCPACAQQAEAALMAVAALRSAGYGLKPLEVET